MSRSLKGRVQRSSDVPVADDDVVHGVMGGGDDRSGVVGDSGHRALNDRREAVDLGEDSVLPLCLWPWWCCPVSRRLPRDRERTSPLSPAETDVRVNLEAPLAAAALGGVTGVPGERNPGEPYGGGAAAGNW